MPPEGHRRLADGSPRLAPKRRASKSEYTEEDLQAWTPVALGERVVSDRKLRRAGRDAASLAQHAARANQQIEGAEHDAAPVSDAQPAAGDAAAGEHTGPEETQNGGEADD